jgi:hypothetical protein
VPPARPVWIGHQDIMNLKLKCRRPVTGIPQCTHRRTFWGEGEKHRAIVLLANDDWRIVPCVYILKDSRLQQLSPIDQRFSLACCFTTLSRKCW